MFVWSEAKPTAALCRQGHGHHVHRGAEVFGGTSEGEPREPSGHSLQHRLEVVTQQIQAIQQVCVI